MDDPNWLLEDLRVSIDNLDQALLPLLSERIRLSKKWSLLAGLEASLEASQSFANPETGYGVNQDFIIDLFASIFAESSLESLQKTYSKECEPLGIDLDSLGQSLCFTDQALLSIFGERFSVVLSIGKLKANLGRVPLDQNRWDELLAHKKAEAAKFGLGSEFIEELFTRIHKESLSLEAEVVLEKNG